MGQTISVTDRYFKACTRNMTDIVNGCRKLYNSLFFKDFDHVEPLNVKQKTSDEVRLRKGCTATLTCIPTSSNIFPVKWTNLPVNTWRRSRRFPNGSLQIRNAAESDSDSRVTCEFAADQGVSGKRSIGIHVVQSGMKIIFVLKYVDKIRENSNQSTL